MKFDQPYLSENNMQNIKVFAGYERKLLYILIGPAVKRVACTRSASVVRREGPYDWCLRG